MITFACDAIHPGCEATFRAASAMEVVPLLTMHAWRTHNLMMPHLPASVVKVVLRSCQPVPVAVALAADAVPAPRSEPVVLPVDRMLDVVRLESSARPLAQG